MKFGAFSFVRISKYHLKSFKCDLNILLRYRRFGVTNIPHKTSCMITR